MYVVLTDKTINIILNEYNILAYNESKSNHDWVEWSIHWELCKILQFDYADMV